MELMPLGLQPSFGFGDRLGLATPGHIDAVRGTRFTPVFAQQSVRENQRTGRTPQQVMDDARRAVEAARWDAPWGADADHLKTLEDLAPFVSAGYTFFTIDPGEHVDNAADTDPVMVLQEKTSGFDWDDLTGEYLDKPLDLGFGVFGKEKLMQAVAKYGKALQHTQRMYNRLREMKDEFDFEVSVDETESPTTPFEHYFIVNELTRKGVRFTSLAPRFIGRFEKGVDYIGDLQVLDAEMARHAAVTTHFGSYKLSLHSGSDKFSVYPLLVKHWGENIHVKTAGTSYLEALRTIADHDSSLFMKIWDLALARYPIDRTSYHVSADVLMVPKSTFSSALLEDFHAREILHVTFGSALHQYGAEIRMTLQRNAGAYSENLKRHFKKHLKLLGGNA